MSQDTENFDQLRRLLALKRHEVPPPGYFNDFSRQVISQIKLGRHVTREGVVERLLWETPWLQRIWAAVETKPALATVFGLAVCGLLITGVVLSANDDAQTASAIQFADPAGFQQFARVAAGNHPLLEKPAVIEPSSTSPIGNMPSDGPLLGSLRAQPASFTFPAGN